MNKRLLENCKEAVADVDGNKLSDLLSSFDQRQGTAKKQGDGELEFFMKLLWGLFSMYFVFAKGKPFGPIATFNDGSRTMLPEDLNDIELSMLEELVQEIDNAQFIARVCDVLWIRRGNYLHAQKAVKAYIQSIDQDNDEMWVPRGEWLKRATQIAMELGEKATERKIVKNKLFSLFEDSRKKCFNPMQDYWPAAILALIIDNKFSDNWDDLGDKVIEIAKGFPVSPGCDAPRRYYELAAKCYQYAGNQEKEKGGRLAIAKHWEDEGRSFVTPQGCDGFNLAHRLEKAIHAYREAGNSEKAEELIHELKDANKEAINQMKPIKSEVDITGLIKFVDETMQNKTSRECFIAFDSLYQSEAYE